MVDRLRGSGARVAGTALLLMLVSLDAPVPTAAHAALVSSDPADGATLRVSPAEITLRFDEAIDPRRSRLQLRDARGGTVAEGGVAGDDASRLTMRLEPPPLAQGDYEVRWVAVTPDDGSLERGTISFTVAAGSASSTALPTTRPSGVPATSGAPIPSSPSVTAGPRPVASPQAPVGATDSGADLILPLLAVGAVAASAVLFLLRRPR